MRMRMGRVGRAIVRVAGMTRAAISKRKRRVMMERKRGIVHVHVFMRKPRVTHGTHGRGVRLVIPCVEWS